MSTAFEKLKMTTDGHKYDYVAQDTGIHYCRHDHYSPQSTCWKATVNGFLASNLDDPESASVDEFAQQMIKRIDPGSEPVLVKYVFIAEAIDELGDRASYSAATDNIAIWDEMGLLKYGMSLCDAKMISERLRGEM